MAENKTPHSDDSTELRRLAEERFEEDGDIVCPSWTVEDLPRLLHEMQVYQIELDMQAEQLHQERFDKPAELEKFINLYEFAPVGYVTLDRVGDIRGINLTGSNFIGGERSRLIGQHFRLFVTAETRPAFADFLEKVFSSQTKETCEVALREEGDSKLVVQIEGIAAASGEECRLALLDITKRKQIEMALKRSEQQYRATLHTLLDGFWIVDMQGRFIDVNNAYSKIIGYTRSELLGMFIQDVEALERKEDIENRIKNIFLYGSHRFESQHRCKNGHIVDLEICVSRIPNTDRLCASLRDITDLKQNEKKLQVSYRLIDEARKMAEAANSAKSSFLSTMSHEIRTPMNSVIGMIELLQHTQLTSEQNELAEKAKKAGIELVHLLNDILDLSKIDADKMELDLSEFNLQHEISVVISLMSLSAHEKALRLVSTIDPDVPTALKGDAVRQRQIIVNLISNAIKFTPKGSVTLLVQKEAEEDNFVTLRYTIKDTGIGIATNKLEQIFQPFTQANSSVTRTYGGTGLGLSICRRLAELMGGSIGVESTEGEGSTFWFTTVLEKQNKTEINNTSASVSGSQVALHIPGKSTGNRIRILLTEDDPSAQEIVPKLLEYYGYQVDVAGNGKEALQALQNYDYGLVLMDCMMPDMSGYEVTAIIRDPVSTVRRHDIPIIALTGNAMKEDRDQCTAAGMDDHLSKPLILADLLAKLDIWLKTAKV